jgi:hypothetical protein
MGSITRVLPNPAKSLVLQRWLQHACLLLGLGAASWAMASHAFVIQHAELQLRNNVYHLNANIDYRFSSEAMEALTNGVPLLIRLNIRVQKVRDWWFDKDVAALEQGYLLIYHALTEKYIIHNLNSGTQQNYISLHNALRTLGQVNELPVLDANLLDTDSRYSIELRTALDIESLPAPMRLLAYISNDWQLQSDTYTWTLQH